MCPRLSRHPAVVQALRELDAGTSAHCDRTGGLAEMLGRALRLDATAKDWMGMR